MIEHFEAIPMQTVCARRSYRDITYGRLGQNFRVSRRSMKSWYSFCFWLIFFLEINGHETLDLSKQNSFSIKRLIVFLISIDMISVNANSNESLVRHRSWFETNTRDNEIHQSTQQQEAVCFTFHRTNLTLMIGLSLLLSSLFTGGTTRSNFIC